MEDRHNGCRRVQLVHGARDEAELAKLAVDAIHNEGFILKQLQHLVVRHLVMVSAYQCREALVESVALELTFMWYIMSSLLR